MLKIWFNRTVYAICLIAVVWILIQNHVIEFGNLSKNDLTKNVKTIPSKVLVHDTVLKWKHDTQTVTKNHVVTKTAYKTTTDTFTLDKRYQVAVGDSQGCGSDSLTQTVKIKDLKPLNDIDVAQLKNKLFLGADLGYSATLKAAFFAPKIEFETKNGLILSGSYDLINKTPTIGAAWKVHLGK